MAQVTIYMDEETLKKIEAAANKEHDSISKWIKKRLVKELKSSWPKDYFDLLGSLRDDSFKRPPQPSWSSDRRRQRL